MTLTVWAVYTGNKYARRYLHHLRAGVQRHLHQPHQFKVLTDHWLPEFDRDATAKARPGLPGWWQKLALFDPTLTEPGSRNLYIDLDSVIVGDLDPMLDRHRDAPLAMPRNWARSGHGGNQSSVMIWRGGAHPELFHDITLADRARLWGDQEWITERLGQRVEAIPHPDVVSYKYHCQAQGEPPAGARVVTFHGKPDPHEVGDQWVKAAWSSSTTTPA